MSRLRLRVILLGLLLLVGTGAVAHAQAETLPLYAVIRGAVMRLNGAGLDFYPFCQPNEGIQAPLLLAPDGRYFAMLTQPEVVRQGILATGSAGSSVLPSNLWVCDTRAGTLIKVNDQPPGAVYLGGDVPDTVNVRSIPAWSPDGLAIAWTELRFPAGTPTLMIYNLARNLLYEVPLSGFPLPPGLSAPPPVFWGRTGLMMLVFALDATTFELLETAYLFDGEGNYQQATLIARSGEQADVLIERLLIEHEGQEYWGLLYAERGWQLVDPLTGQMQPMPGIPELVNRRRPEALGFLVQITRDYQFNWQVFDPATPEAEPRQFLGVPLARLALGDDGQRIALGTSSIQLIAADGSVTELANSAGFAQDFFASLVWAPTAWRVRAGVKFANDGA